MTVFGWLLIGLVSAGLFTWVVNSFYNSSFTWGDVILVLFLSLFGIVTLVACIFSLICMLLLEYGSTNWARKPVFKRKIK